jgi:hypothetical protein
MAQFKIDGIGTYRVTIREELSRFIQSCVADATAFPGRQTRPPLLSIGRLEAF